MESLSQDDLKGEAPRKIYVVVYREAGGEVKRVWFASRESALQAANRLGRDYEIQEATV